MEKHFTENEWNDQIRLDDGTTKNGIVFHLDKLKIAEPIIQVFEKVGEVQYQLIFDPSKVFVGVSDVDIFLFPRQPFAGKVIIK